MSFGVPTVNEVGLPTMHAVIVALMAQGKPVADFVTKGREILHRFNVMRLKASICSAMLARVIISLENSRFPGKVLGAASSLRLLFRLAFGYALTRLPAIDVRANTVARSLNKSFAANFASVFYAVLSALARTIDFSTHMRRRPINFLAASNTLDCHLLRLRSGITCTATKPLLGIFVPVPIAFFGNDTAASFTGF